MAIHLLSDLHTEFWRCNKEQLHAKLEQLVEPADTLILAGDISTGRSNTLVVLKYFASKYKNVVFTPGNHEYYGGLGINDFNDHQEFGSKLPNNVHFLNPGMVYIDTVPIIGATLWTNFRGHGNAKRTAKAYIADFKRMKDVTPELMQETFYYHLNYIKYNYEQLRGIYQYTGPIIIVTHFMPAKELVHPKWMKDEVSRRLNDYFANDLGAWIAELKNVTWLFGHTHDRVEQTIGSTRCLSNPLGYPGENTNYKSLIL